MLLGLHMICLVAVVMLGEGEFKNEVHVVVSCLGLRLLFKLKQIVDRVVKEYVPLNDLVTLNIELVLR